MRGNHLASSSLRPRPGIKPSTARQPHLPDAASPIPPRPAPPHSFSRLWTLTQLSVRGYRIGSVEMALLISGVTALVDSLVRLWNITRRAARGELHCTPAHAVATILPVPVMARSCTPSFAFFSFLTAPQLPAGCGM